jgi:soluble lytic murein transglycosylase
MFRCAVLGLSLAVLAAAPHQALAGPAMPDHELVTAVLPPPPPPPVILPRPLALAEQDSVRQALAAYIDGDIADGDAFAGLIDNRAAQVAAEWAAIRSAQSRLGFRRLAAFVRANPDFAGTEWVRRRAEEALLAERRPPSAAAATFLQSHPPLTAHGKLMLAKLRRDGGDAAAATSIAVEAFADPALPRDLEAAWLREFPDTFSREMVRNRAHRLILRGRKADGLKLAATLGAEEARLAGAIAHAAGKGENPAVMAAVPPQMRESGAFRLADLQVLRRAGHTEAARIGMLKAPREPDRLVDADEWWIERRALVRRLLDSGDPASAYRVAAEHGAVATGRKVDAEFHAGWIALRSLGFADTAAMHFDRLMQLAETPISQARGAYWRARAAEAGASGPPAAEFHAQAARHPVTFHGQLSVAALGQDSLSLREITLDGARRAGFRMRIDVQAAGLLVDAGHQELARPLLLDLARQLSEPQDIEALLELVSGMKDAGFQLAVAKLAGQRGFAVDAHAFPTFGIPEFERREGSADPAMVYAIARQESAFNAKAVSSANARGLMQMLPSTAARTAARMRVPFSPARLTNDPAFNATLGAYHVGELLAETRGSLVLAIAAYNAGGPRVNQWIKTAGDPRKGEIDWLDWIERIPIYETRNYVHRVMENLQVYRARFGGNRSALLIRQDMMTGTRRPAGKEGDAR